MKTMKQLLEAKGSHVWTISPDASIFEAIQLMDEKQIGALVIVDGNKTVGIVSERDYARKIILHDRSSRETAVREIMSAKVMIARPDQSVHDCLALMTERRVRHLPVVDGDDLLGMVSIGDLVKAVIADQQFQIEQLEHYISG